MLLGLVWPGNRHSGPHQSVIGWCKAFKGEIDFKIVARDRAFGTSGRSTQRAGLDRSGLRRVLLSPLRPRRASEGLGDILRETAHDILISNGLFDPTFTLSALVLRHRKRIPEPAR